MKQRNCRECGCCINRRDGRAILCFSCLATWAKRVGANSAYKSVIAAVRAGVLPKAKTLQCVDCNKPAMDWDHRDYNKPLEVEPVCRSCNKLRGPAKALTCAEVAKPSTSLQEH